MDPANYPTWAGRWRRFVLRMRCRAEWHLRGLLLSLLQLPQIRFAPLPYPRVSDALGWENQVEEMMANKSLARKHGVKAMRGKVLSSANLQHCISLRNRMGLELAFLEDPLLQGILAAKTTKGMAARIRAQALEDLKQEAKKNKAEGKQQEAVRQLIGPRGGLPVLKTDLVKLACLVNVEVGQDDTVEKLRAKVKPLVDAIALKPAPKSAPAKAKAVPSSAPPVQENPPKSLPLGPSSSQEPVAKMDMAEVHQLMQEQEARFQGMMTQAMQYFIGMQGGTGNMTEVHQFVNLLMQQDRLQRGEQADAQMEQREPTEEELWEINGLHQRELEEENFIAVHGSLPGDDLDLVKPNLDDP